MKILVCGDVNGQFSTLISKVNAIVKRTGAYDALFCVGEFFGKDKVVNRQLLGDQFIFPISTYVLGPSSEDTSEFYENVDGCNLCKNVLYLGKKGFFSSASSLSVAYLSGLEGNNGIKTVSNFDMEEILSLKNSLPRDFRGVDILLTSQWPKDVAKYGSNLAEEDKVVGSHLVSQLALLLKPRYHFSGSDNISYERQPYRNHAILSNTPEQATRFVALAAVGNAEKKKFIYAFHINPMKTIDGSELTKQPNDVTEAPYKSDPSIFVAKEANVQKKTQFFYDQQVIDSGTVDHSRKRRVEDQGGNLAKRQNKNLTPISPDSCWFCLANPKVEKHLVTSIGDQCYLALAKGGLSEDHVLIIPINHTQSLVTSEADVLNEIKLYKESLKKYFRSIGKCVVFYERNFKTSHLQIQAVPLPKSCEDVIEASIIGFAESRQMQLKELPQMSELNQIIPSGAPYLYVETPQARFFMNIKSGFPLNFGREMLCLPSLLCSPEKIDWKACQLSKEEEDACCSKFRNSFKLFDPFL